MSTAKNISINKKKLEQAVQMYIPISITTYTLPHQTEIYITAITQMFLQLVHKTAIQEYVIYCLKELANNAKKANTKRIYFKEKGFTIDDSESYAEGIKNFKEESLGNIDYYLEQQKKEGLYIKVTMQAKDDHICFEVSNNVKMVVDEFKRIYDRIVLAREYNEIEEVLLSAVDELEGAGLGLIIMLLMLKKIGLDENAFELEAKENLTMMRIVIPRDFTITRHVNELCSAVVNYVENIPQFPEKIIEIERTIKDAKVQMSTIASLISDDIALTTDLLKLVNSAAFGLTKKCMNIQDAVNLAGLRSIQNLLYTVGTLQILDIQHSEQKELWDHSYKSAFFAYSFARKKKYSKIIDDVYVCALLHNLGKIIFSGMYPNILAKLTEIQKQKNIPPEVVKSLIQGMEHQKIGAALAEKWNLPQPIINTIKYQYEPRKAPPEYFQLIATVSFSEFMIQFHNGTIQYQQIPSSLLTFHGINDRAELVTICTGLDTAFQDNESDTQ